MYLMKKLTVITCGAVFASLGMANVGRSSTFINTCETIDCLPIKTAVGDFGFGKLGDCDTVGQTFTVPITNNVLTQFNFFLSNGSAPVNLVNFRAFIVKIDKFNSILTGSILYESDTRSTQVGENFQSFVFDTGELSLISGEKYAAFLFALENPNANFGKTSIAETNTDSYAGGDFFLARTNGDFSQLFSKPLIVSTGLDASFQATLIEPDEQPTPVPEPSSIAGLILFGLSFFLKKKLKHCD